MGSSNTLSIIIPAFNEADNLKTLLPPLIELCTQNHWKIILVNDGSHDKTKEILDEFQQNEYFTVIHHKINRGYGGAIKSGIIHADSEYVITIDADGQHRMEDIEKLFRCITEKDADMIVGSRKGLKSASLSRSVGKTLIRTIAKLLMNVPVYDINSGMKIYRTELARKYLCLAPNTMSYSDIITLIFINNRHLVLEEPIVITKRLTGKSTISIETAFNTVMEIINIVILFNPAKVFIPLSLISLLMGIGFGLPGILSGRGISTGCLLGIVAGIIFFLLGLIAEQLSLISRNRIN
ncbi:MAG TPA: glycosyltransferase [Bacteroidales bacterium]|nr:glycosyltransferase [Bacteroidales bacterium]